MTKDLEKLRAAIIPHRVRRIGSDGFAFIPHRFLRDGFLAALQHDELALYLFLLLAGNRDGVSFYRYDSICSILKFSLDDYIETRRRLIELDLIAFKDNRFQVLSLPTEPITPHDTRADALDPAMIRAAIIANLESDDA